MVEAAKTRGWTTVHFERVRVLSTTTNPVLMGTEGRRIRTQYKQLLRKGLQLGVYYPPCARDSKLEAEMNKEYETWRAQRNATQTCQAYVTIFDLFSFPRIMVIIYIRGPDGKINGFAGLRRLRNGYHIDPCIAASASQSDRPAVDSVYGLPQTDWGSASESRLRAS